MIKSKALSDAGWKDIATKNKVKDNGLLKALVKLGKLDEDEHDDALKTLAEVLKLAAPLQKEEAAVAAAGKYLAELIDAADLAVREVTKAKAKAESAKARKAKADAADDEEEETPALLTTQMVPLLRLVARGETLHTLMASSGKKLVVMLSRKPIPPARRKLLAEQLGGGGIKYYTGECLLEDKATTFVLQPQTAGLAKRIRAALLEQTGRRLTKVICRGDEGGRADNDLVA